MKKILQYLALIILTIIVSCKKETSCEDCATKNNKPPIAVAGPDQVITLPTDSVLLDGNSSGDPDGMISEWLWTKISGPASFNITNVNNVQTQVTNLVQGIYQFELKVTDADGLLSKDTIQVIVDSSSTGPSTENAGPDIIITLPLDSVYLFGNTSTWPAAFEWTQISGPSTALITASNAGYYPGSAILAQQLIPGFYSFKLIVNNAGITNVDTVNVWVINNPQDSNTITFKNLKWHLADTYGSGFIDLDIVTPGQPNLFITWDQLRPVEIYLQLDSTFQWFQVPSGQSGSSYIYDAGLPRIWIVRSPVDNSWVGKESNVKIKLL